MELDVVYQKYLDESTYCELCNASMMWFEGEFNSLELQYHVCTNCGHSYLPEKALSPCQCQHCLEQRRKTIRETLKYEKYESRQKTLKSKDQLEILLDDVEEFAENVMCQHYIIAYGDQTDKMENLCNILGIEII